jgi:hypothetical protein
MKLQYKPFALVGGVIAARIGKTLFTKMWARIDDEQPPLANAPGGSLVKVVGARSLEGATMAGVAAAVERATARTFHHLTGVWPEENPEEQ